MRSANQNESNSLNRTFEVDTPSVLNKVPLFATSSPNEMTSSPIKRFSGELMAPGVNVLETPSHSMCTPEPQDLKVSLENHYLASRPRRNSVLFAPRSVHRGRVKNKTPQGSAERSCLLQALRASHLERDELSLDMMVCGLTTPFRSIIRTEKHGGVREHAPTRAFVTPTTSSCLFTLEPPTPVTAFHSPIRTTRYGGLRERHTSNKSNVDRLMPPDLCVSSSKRNSNTGDNNTDDGNNLNSNNKLIDSPGSMTRCRLREILHSSYSSAKQRVLKGTSIEHFPLVSNKAVKSKVSKKKKQVSFKK